MDGVAGKSPSFMLVCFQAPSDQSVHLTKLEKVVPTVVGSEMNSNPLSSLEEERRRFKMFTMKRLT